MTFFAEPIESAKMTSSAKSPTVDDISTSVSGRRSDEEFEFVDNFKIPKEYAALYKKIFHKYGHMGTRKVIKSNYTVLVAFVTSLLKIISTMEAARGADLSEALLETWEGDIEDAENLGFNIEWLRKKFDEVKNIWKSSSGIRKDIEIYEKELDATQVKYVDLLARKEELLRETSKVIIEIRKAEAKISSIQEKLAPENNFLNEPILGKLLS
ncbi:MATH domain and coiled-coil domain-containing protein At3g58240-like [Papaver somniferum]|uniref:MATH domain and coiled-coil domain-containing protein At3g58240-like n=1 Tax=Papaver somniferum TaxID=3469 RepID=UPI000E6FCA62|nr:MATH domain and coiled-coil domain-containing protein At3g58240-like [Papaver somniferum]